MDETSPSPVSVVGDHAQVGLTGTGDVNINLPMTPPPEGTGKLCPVHGCGVPNWQHAPTCRACGHDFHRWRRIAYRAAVITLLVLIAIIGIVALQRI